MPCRYLKVVTYQQTINKIAILCEVRSFPCSIQIPYACVTVSYTHLDVYKRQVRGRFIYTICYTPVSYTHLDVYKRQV